MNHWVIRSFKQATNNPSILWCAVAGRIELSKRWIINAEGPTEKEAIKNLEIKIKDE